jgi:hypothetical protein
MNVLVDFERQLRVPLVGSPPAVRVHSRTDGICKREVFVADAGATSSSWIWRRTSSARDYLKLRCTDSDSAAAEEEIEEGT